MKDFLRFGGAQIPCSKSITDNVITLKKAINWAAENSVDYLVTPEASLSGYNSSFVDELDLMKSSLKEIEDYAKEKRVGLFLGTLWLEEFKEGNIKRNQIRLYDKEGIFKGSVDKIITTPYDEELGILPGNKQNYLVIKENEDFIPICGFICNDFYGKEDYPNLTNIAFTEGITFFIHSTNAERNRGPLHHKIFDDWHNAHFQLISYLAKLPVITVDNCWHMNGDEWDGPTSSPSGVIISGEWKLQVPRTGTQYFYYDFPIKKLLDRDWK